MSFPAQQATTGFAVRSLIRTRVTHATSGESMLPSHRAGLPRAWRERGGPT